MLAKASRPVFAHALWRTGSTYLASRFAESEQYMLFYEPCHEYVGDRRRIREARVIQDRKRAALHHPDVGGGYFDAYEQIDPLTGRSLTSLYEPTAALRDVYNDVSSRTIAFLEACARVATAQGRTAVFGFCRSGTAQLSMARAMPGTRLYLWRDPREQFRSYNWPANDYFVPGTLLQLLRSRAWHETALEIGDGRLPRVALGVLERLPDRLTSLHYRVGRVLARRLSAPQLYGLFYLAWLVSRDAARAAETSFVSLSELASSPQQREAFEQRFALQLDGLKPTPPVEAADPRLDDVEAHVRRLSGLTP